jgi:manganese oxidase
MATPRARLLVVAALVGSVVAWGLPTTAADKSKGLFAPPVESCDSPTETRTLFANEVGKQGRIGYGISARNITIPGPTLEITEGSCLQVDLVNKASRPVSIHTHGVKYTFASDGTPLNKGCVAPGEAGSFVFSADAPAPQAGGTMSPGTAGYWHYHDHCMGTPHGTTGVQKGLYGALIVRRPGDPEPDTKPFVVVMNDLTINNRRAPNTPIFKANEGQRIEFVVIAHGENFHTFHLHAHSWFDNRTGTLAASGDTLTPVIDNKPMGPADSFGFQVIAGEGVGPGAWMFHCHVQSHSDGGMSGLLAVRTAGGTMTQQTKNAIERWRKQHGGGHHG